MAGTLDDNSLQCEAEVGSKVSPFFSGQIGDAIIVAKSNKKSLIVYIAGNNQDCQLMDQTTWQDVKVHEVLSQRFVTIHLQHGSTDAAHFSAIFPYKEVPTVTVISHNGMLLKKVGRYVSPAELLGMLEQAMAIQQTATIVAALASANVGSATSVPESQVQRAACEPAEAARSEREGSSGSSSSSIGRGKGAAPGEKGKGPVRDETQMPEHVAQSGAQFHTPATTEGGALEALKNEVEPVDENVPHIVDVNISHHRDESRALDSSAHDTHPSATPNVVLHQQASKVRPKAQELLLQVRLTNGKSIRKVFNHKDILALVKTFVDESQDDANTNYSLAMLYPRKVFSHEDMEKTLDELNLEDRATLVVVMSSSQQTAKAADSARAPPSPPPGGVDSGGGIWRILSYLNPFTYFSGSPNRSESGSSSWQYEPNPRFQEAPRQNAERRSLSSPNAEATASRSKKSPQDTNWGGNIHTLKHTDEDDMFKRGNTFWNGNSTQYGGDDDSRK